MIDMTDITITYQSAALVSSLWKTAAWYWIINWVFNFVFNLDYWMSHWFQMFEQLKPLSILWTLSSVGQGRKFRLFLITKGKELGCYVYDKVRHVFDWKDKKIKLIQNYSEPILTFGYGGASSTSNTLFLEANLVPLKTASSIISSSETTWLSKAFRDQIVLTTWCR